MRDHSVAFFVEPFLRHADPRVSFEIFSNCAPGTQDATSKRLRGYAAAWHDCGHMPHNAIDPLIRSRNIDVLIELSGHAGEPRLLALIEKPAPVLITAIGYPNTTGVPAIDWRLVDAITDPPGSEGLCTERLLRIDPCFLCYTAPTQAPEPELPEASQPITFGSFNNAAKIGPATAALWARAMRAVPESRLLLKSTGLVDPAIQQVLQRLCMDAGVPLERVEMVGITPDQRSHLQMYNRVHVALDTTPYNGTTTTCEALWMGVPVVTLRGRTHTSRMGASILQAIGKAEWVAGSDARFVQIAAGLATNATALSAWRESARAHLQQSDLFDERGFAADFEQTLQRAWTAAGSRAALVATHQPSMQTSE
jgi:predicted O-linked N-acetylglucosamine transferase (SPINDLY family)